MRVLVTGANGFIGSYVCEELVRRDHTPIAFDRHGVPQSYETYLGDIRDATAVTEAMAHVDGWIHLAGILGTQETIENPRPALETNIMGGINVLEAASQYRVPGVNIAVGNHTMNNTYAISKSAVERFCLMYRDYRDVAITVVRAFNAYGPRQIPSQPHGPSRVRKILPSFIMRALHNEPIEVYGDGLQIMDMIPAQSVAEILVHTLEVTHESGTEAPVPMVIEAGSGIPTTVKQIAEVVVASANSSSEIKYLPMRPGEPERSVVLADTSTLSYIGFDPLTIPSLSEEVDRVVEWYREAYLGPR